MVKISLYNALRSTLFDSCKYLFFIAALFSQNQAYASVVTAQPDYSIGSSDTVRLGFDFSGQAPAPPYQNINFAIFFGANDLNLNEGFTIQAFDSTDQAVSNPLTFLEAAISGAGGGISSGFGGPAGNFFGQLTSPTGYLEMSDIVGSFDLTRATVQAADLNYFPPGTPWINVSSIQVNAVPEPGSVSLLILGLGVIAFTVHRKEEHRPGPESR